MLFNLLQTDIVEAAEAAPIQQEMSYSIVDMAVKGGWLMIVLLILSIIAVYIFGKKLWLISKAGKIDRNFLMDIRDYLHEGKIKSAKTLCSKFDTPVARMAEAGLEKCGKSSAEIQTTIENMGNLEIARIEKGLPYLAMIAGGAPMIGFLGTVIGMVQAFFNMSMAGSNIDIALLSGGIYTAMITTVGGLIVGIVAYFGYNFLTSKVSDLAFRMESATVEMVDILSAEENKTAAE